MNRRQKVLTVIALIAFVVIGACHYLGPLVEFHTSRLVRMEQRAAHTRKIWNHMDALTQYGIKGGSDFDVEGNDTQLICDIQEVRNFVPEAGGVPQHLKKNRTHCLPPVHDVWAPHFSARYNQQMQPDVRMPWFMLGVIYTGLFFLLVDRKEKQ